MTHWSSPDTRLAEVMSELGRMRQMAGATRAAVVNLVVLAAGDAGADRAVESIFGLGRSHPGRIIVVVPRPGGPGTDRMSGRIDVHSEQIEGRTLWWDVIRLEVGGAALAHSDSLVDPLLLHDLHVAVWLVGGTSRIESAGLLGLADQVIVSGERAALVSAASASSDLTALSRRRPVADLAWVAIDPARQALARLLGPPAPPGMCHSIAGLSVEGPPWSSRLFAAWVCERTGLDPGQVSVSESEFLRAELRVAEETVRLDAGPVWPAGVDARQTTDPPSGAEPAHTAAGTGPGAATATGFGRRCSVPHGGSATPQLLAGALSHPYRDRRYEAALPLAGRLGT